jgi:hypothetical protein
LPWPVPSGPQPPSPLLLRFLQALLRIDQENVRNGLDKQAVLCRPVEAYGTKCQLFARVLGRVSYFCHLGPEIVPSSMHASHTHSQDLLNKAQRVPKLAPEFSIVFQSPVSRPYLMPSSETSTLRPSLTRSNLCISFFYPHNTLGI